MKKSLIFIALAVAAAFAFSACGDKDAPFETVIPKRPIMAPIKEVSATCGAIDAITTIDNEARAILLEFASPDADLSKVQVKLTLISRAVPSTGCFTDSLLNLTSAYSFAIFNGEEDIIFSIKARKLGFKEMDYTNVKALVNYPGDATLYAPSWTPGEDWLFNGIREAYWKDYAGAADGGGGYTSFGWMATSPKPWFTIDLGEAKVLYKMIIYPYYGCSEAPGCAPDPCLYDFWAFLGTTLPETTPENWMTSGDWVMIADCDASWAFEKTEALRSDSSKIGNPEYDPVTGGFEDVFVAPASGMPQARYYRLRCKQSFGAKYYNQTARSNACCITEMRLWEFSEEESD